MMISFISYNTNIGTEYYKRDKMEQITINICTKCGTTYELNPYTNTEEYCDKCRTGIRDSYEDIISAIEDQYLRTHPYSD